MFIISVLFAYCFLIGAQTSYSMLSVIPVCFYVMICGSNLYKNHLFLQKNTCRSVTLWVSFSKQTNTSFLNYIMFSSRMNIIISYSDNFYYFYVLVCCGFCFVHTTLCVHQSCGMWTGSNLLFLLYSNYLITEPNTP